MIKKFLLLTVFLLACLASPLMADGELVNGIDANFPPFAFVASDGVPNGFDIEAVNWIADKLNFKVAHKPMEWDTIVTSLKDKKIDLIASGLSVTPQRAEQIAFTKPYWTIKQVVLVKKDSALTAEEILKGDYDIGVQQGTSDAEAMENSNGKDGRKYSLKHYSSPELAATDVANGRITAAVMNDAPAAEAANKIDVIIVGNAGIPDEEFAIGVNKENPELLATLNEGLDLLMKDPFWQTLVDKYKPGFPE
jgi:polar amino acid transport system substrate-binding protein